MRGGKRDRLEALETLVASEGWRVLAAYLATQREGAVNAALGDGVDDRRRSDEALVARTLRNVLDWPTGEIDFLRKQINKEN